MKRTASSDRLSSAESGWKTGPSSEKPGASAGAVLQIKAVPNAKHTVCAGLMADGLTWKIRLAAPPEDGRANEVLLAWLAETLQVSKKALTLHAGAASRSKRVAVEGMDAETVTARLGSAGK